MQAQPNKARAVHGPTFASAFHWNHADESRLASGIFSAMRIAFEARWVELGYAGVPIPATTIDRLRVIARTQATSTVRAHNTAVTRFILATLKTYAQEHDGSTAGAHEAVLTAVTSWLANRVASHGAMMASSQTLHAQTLADLATGTADSRYIVEGPPLTDASCLTCQHYVGHTLTHDEAAALTFPAHPNCLHIIRRLS